MGPLVQSTTNSRYYVRPDGTPVYLTGSHTWDDFQDKDTSASPAPFNLTNFIAMLKADNHNATIVWNRDSPRECNWNGAPPWNLKPQIWIRSATPGASDGGNKFDLTQFNQPFFDRMASEVSTLQANGIYAIIELFDTADLSFTRCGTTSPSGDGFPLTGINNINGVSDGYTSGATGVGAYTMTGNNGITAIQDAYIKKLVDTLNAFPNVLWEVAEEQPGTSFAGTPGYGGASSLTFWAPHILELLKTYEGGGTCTSCSGTPTFTAKPFLHPAGIGSMNVNDVNDAALYALTNASWIAPTINSNFNNQFPCVPATNNQGKIVIQDTDHSCDASTLVVPATGAINDVQARQAVWKTFTNGGSGFIFMDPYVISFTGNNRNPCASPVNGICANPMTKYDPLRQTMGYVNLLTPKINNLLAMTPQAALASTGFALARNIAGGEFVIYAPSGGAFTVNLTAEVNRSMQVQWFNPLTGAFTTLGPVIGGSATQSFTPPWGSANDAVLHLMDIGPVYAAGWTEIPSTTPNTLCPSVSTFPNINGSEGCAAVMNDWSGGWSDTRRNRLEFWGGGHAGYYGNEVYYFDPSLRTIGRYTDPANVGSTPGPNGDNQCSGTPFQNLVWQNTTPNITHNYQGNVYLFNVDKMLTAMGDLSRGTNNCPASALNDALARFWGSWTFNLSTLNFAALPNAAGHWTPLDPLTNGGLAAGPNGSISFINHPSCNPAVTGACSHLGWGRDGTPLGEYASSAWWPQQQRALMFDDFTMYAYDPGLNVGTELAASGNLNTSSTSGAVGDYDPDHQIYLIIGSGITRRFHTDTFTTDILTMTGCATVANTQGPGLSYDSGMKLFAGWVGGQTVYLINATDNPIVTTNFGTVPALNCVSTNPVSTTGNFPPTPPAAGTNGRFRFVPSLNGQDVYTLCPQMNANCFVLNLNPVTGTGYMTFAQRAATPGVIYSNALDSAALITPGLQPAGDGVTRMSYDPLTSPPGEGINGSLDTLMASAYLGQNMSGQWQSPAWSTQFGPVASGFANNQLFVQYRYMEDTASASQWPGGHAGRKTSIISHAAATCASLEQTTLDDFERGYPQMYTNCGSQAYEVNLGNGDFLYQQSTPVDGTTNTNWRYNCHRNFGTTTECGFTDNPTAFYANNWITVYETFTFTGPWCTFGDAGCTAVPNATVKSYMGYDKGTIQPDGTISDGSLKQFINYSPALGCNTTPGCETGSPVEGYNAITLLPYETSGSGAHPDAHRHYCCVLASTQPIPAPSLVATFSAPPITDVYLAQAALGLANGNSCANAFAASYFNSSANWGTPGPLIGGGMTIHLCGNISTPTLSTPTSQGTGLITVVWEPGAKLSAPANQNFIIVNNTNQWKFNGGFPCGPQVTGTVACNGVIENTANGTDRANQVFPVRGFELSNATGAIEITGLDIRNLYVHSAPIAITNISSNGTTQVTVTCATTCGKVAGETRLSIEGTTNYNSSGNLTVTSTSGTTIVFTYPGTVTAATETSGEIDDGIITNTSVNCEHSNPVLANLTIHDSDCHDASWAFDNTPVTTSNGALIDLYDLDIFNIDHAVTLGGTNTNGSFTLKLHDSHIHNWGNWDTGVINAYHHDGIHFFNSQTQAAEVDIYNNLFDFWDGVNNTAPMFNQQSLSNTKIFNNVVVCAVAQNCFSAPLTLHEGGGGPNELMVNNTFIETGLSRLTPPFNHSNDSCVQHVVGGLGLTGNDTEMNNIFTSCTTMVVVTDAVFAANSATSGQDYNLFANHIADGNAAWNWQHTLASIVTNGTTTGTLTCNVTCGFTVGLSLTLSSSTIPAQNAVVTVASTSGTGMTVTYPTTVASGTSTVGKIGQTTNTFATWQAVSGEGTHSQSVASANLSSSGAPLSGSPAIAAGTNLTSLATGNLAPLAFDTSAGHSRVPSARPSTGAWDIGAFLFAGGSPVVSITPSPIAYVNILVGTPSIAIVTVSNPGSATLTLASPYFAISGTNATDFSVSGGTCANGGTVLVGGSCTVQLTFMPLAGGSRSATIAINGNATSTDSISGFGLVNVISGQARVSGQAAIKTNP